MKTRIVPTGSSASRPWTRRRRMSAASVPQGKADQGQFIPRTAGPDQSHSTASVLAASYYESPVDRRRGLEYKPPFCRVSWARMSEAEVWMTWRSGWMVLGIVLGAAGVPGCTPFGRFLTDSSAVEVPVEYVVPPEPTPILTPDAADGRPGETVA